MHWVVDSTVYWTEFDYCYTKTHRHCFATSQRKLTIPEIIFWSLRFLVWTHIATSLITLRKAFAKPRSFTTVVVKLQGKYAGNASGIQISSLMKLSDTKSNKGRITLLHYIVEDIHRKDETVLQFVGKLSPTLKAVSRSVIEVIIKEDTESLSHTRNSLCELR